VVHDQAAAFALDALGPDESVEFERHLAVWPRMRDGPELLSVAPRSRSPASCPATPTAPPRVLTSVPDPAPAATAGSPAAAVAVCLTSTRPPARQATEARGTPSSPSGEGVLVQHSPGARGRREAWIVDRAASPPPGPSGSVLPPPGASVAPPFSSHSSPLAALRNLGPIAEGGDGQAP
jgi:hypothetical protein